MSTDYGSGTTTSDHDLTLAIPGDVDSVRQRLIDAVQKLGYKVIGEQPIYAKRRGRGAARWDCSLNIMEYPVTLTIALRQTNDVAVLATFNYEIKSYMLKGDRQSLAREAEAIAALATERLAVSACRACGTPVTDESHFCRRCGAPMVLDVPELEVLRLTSETRVIFYNVFIGLIGLLLALVTLVPAFILNGGQIYWPMFVGIAGGAYAMVVFTHSLWRLHRTLNPKTTKDVAPGVVQQAVKASVTTALPPARPFASITEGTTELLTTDERRVPEPVRRKDHNTAELDNDRLM